MILGRIKRCAKKVKGRTIIPNPNGPPLIDIIV
jgi:hypothetical protein